MNIIKQLFNGTLEPIRSLGANNPELKELEELMQRNLKRLEEKLDEKGGETLEKYNDCIDEYLMIITEQAFCDGFCLGTKIAVESSTGVERIV